MKRRYLYLVMISLTLVAWQARSARSQTVTPEIRNQPLTTSITSDFDKDVADFRRTLRATCGKLQSPKAASVIRSEDLDLLKDHWSKLQTYYTMHRPDRYANDRRFVARMDEIHSQFATMNDQYRNGRYESAVAACGKACALFVSMHEENGLIYASDKLFILRKSCKTALAAFDSGGASATLGGLQLLLFQRDQMLLAPCPESPGECTSYTEAIHRISARVDDLAIAQRRANKLEIRAALVALLTQINNDYDISL